MESKEDTRANVPEEITKTSKVRHLKTNSYVGSNKMSPTLQPRNIGSEYVIKKFDLD